MHNTKQPVDVIKSACTDDVFAYFSTPPDTMCSVVIFLKKRVWVLFGFLTVFFGVLGVHLYSLVGDNAVKPVAFGENSVKLTVNRTRGTIYDAQMQPLVNEEKTYYAAILPDETLLMRLNTVLDKENLSALSTQILARKPAVLCLDEPIAFVEGVRLFLSPKRYGARLLAAHLIGYTDTGTGEGITGIEAACNEILEKYAGALSVSYPISGTGTNLKGAEPEIQDTIDHSAGGVVLTIQKDIQKIVEDTAPNYLTKGAVVVMEPSSGEVLAMASFPAYHPDNVAQSIEENNGALINRALALYDCGSVFKTVTVAAALENGIPMACCYDCAGGMTVQKTMFHCHKRLGHQTLDMTNAFAQSCNLYFIQLAKEMGAEKLYNTAVKFGFSQSISLIDGLGTPQGVLPSENELTTDAALANFSFGQGHLLASPLQVTRMTAAIANGGVLPAACVVKGYVDENGTFTPAVRDSGEGERVLSQENAAAIQKMMEKVVTDGTGKQAAGLYAAAGKTGTAETGQINEGNPVVQSWFTGYFPAENPRYVVTVLAEDAQNTNGKATPLFCEISNKVMELEKNKKDG